MKQLIGLRTYFYYFKAHEAYLRAVKRLRDKGVITELFAGDGYAFELKLNRRVH